MSDSNHELAEWENWEILRTLLPPEWGEQARRLGAMRRARYISDPETVLRVLLLHLDAGCSLAETAVRASGSGLAQSMRFLRFRVR
jgi:predicted nicotinamide N-methyase